MFDEVLQEQFSADSALVYVVYSTSIDRQCYDL